MPTCPGPYKIPEECDFRKVRERYVPNDCSPEIADREFRGIVINAPKNVTVGERGAPPWSASALFVPLCGTYVHSLGVDIGLRTDFAKSIVGVAVDAKTHRTFSGKIMVDESSRRPDPSPEKKLSPKEMEGRTIRGYFNANLGESLDLPDREAEYIVYATLGPYKSNVLRICVRKRIR
ncbi:MAG: hypothetical protein OHK0028_03370 [Deltaproteobacteria bacterium]